MSTCWDLSRTFHPSSIRISVLLHLLRWCRCVFSWLLRTVSVFSSRNGRGRFWATKSCRKWNLDLLGLRVVPLILHPSFLWLSHWLGGVWGAAFGSFSFQFVWLHTCRRLTMASCNRCSSRACMLHQICPLIQQSLILLFLPAETRQVSPQWGLQPGPPSLTMKKRRRSSSQTTLTMTSWRKRPQLQTRPSPASRMTEGFSLKKHSSEFNQIKSDP